MAFADRTEKGFETTIVDWLVEHNGYEQGSNEDYDREFAVDETRLMRFLRDTQPEEMSKLRLATDADRRRFLNRLSGEIRKRGVIDVLRKGVNVYPAELSLYYPMPTEGNGKAAERYGRNIFSVTRQLRYSAADPLLALDVCVFVNGLPVVTMELKNHLTGQTTADAVEQYKRDRDPRETLFSFKRCMVHFAVDDQTVMFCTRLAGKDSWFLPFNKGFNDGAGNPPNPDGLMTDYLWKDVLTKRKLSRILESYAQVLEDTDPDAKRKTERQIWPRYHQLDCVEKLLADVAANGVGKRYLIEHSAGSGKSNSIAWLAHRLVELRRDGRPLFDSVIVVTDRVILDRQIEATIRQFMQVRGTVQHAEHSGDLKRLIEDGARIIISTVEKFPYIAQDMGAGLKDNRFAVIIDEAHSGQSGRNAANMNRALSGSAGGSPALEDVTQGAVADYSLSHDDFEDFVNRLVEGRRMAGNASYFAFTATPKNKTLEVFGTPYEQDGEVKHRPFHVYTMKQAIEEGFILDVLKNYVPVDSWYRIAKSVEDDPQFDSRRAQKKLRAFVEGRPETVERRARVMVDHFTDQIVARRKLGGRSRAMVVTPSIERCIETYYAVTKALAERRSPYKAIIAFSGEHRYRGMEPPVTSAGINGFPDSRIPAEFRKDPYRILVVADMFQTGFDEPLLQTMYVDKRLSGIAAVQTLSRLNRAMPGKKDVYVLDFANDADSIKAAFDPFYRTTILSAETDPNKLYDLVATMEGYQVYTADDVDGVASLFLSGAGRDKLDPPLDRCVAAYQDLDLDGQIAFKSAAKSFNRTYGFLGSILPYGNPDWEKLYTFLTLLVPKLPSPQGPDFSEGILSDVDLDSYRVEARQAMTIALDDEDAEIAPVPAGSGGKATDPEMSLLSQIVDEFNDLFGNINWDDEDGMRRMLLETIPARVSQDETYRNAMMHSDEQEARTECAAAVRRVVFSTMLDNTKLLNQFLNNKDFSAWLVTAVFRLTYNKDGRPYTPDGGKPGAAGAQAEETSEGRETA